MSLTDELERLAKLKADGVLTPEEFDQAKRKLLSDSGPSRETDESDSLGRAANKYVDWEVTRSKWGAVIVIPIFLIVAFFILSTACSMQSRMEMTPTFHSDFPHQP